MSSTTKIEGVIARGGDVPLIDPNEITIAGLDDDNTSENWFAYCPRAAEPVSEEFTQSVREPNQVDSPVHLCRDGQYTLALAGRRRIKAARIVWNEQKARGVPIADRVRLRFIIHRGTPEQYFAINIRENRDRENLTVLQRAQLYKHHLDRVKGNQRETAKAMGCSQSSVSDTLAVLDCAPAVQHAIEAGALACTHAPKFAKLPRKEQATLLDEMVAKGATRGQSAKKALEGKGVTAPRKVRSRKFLERLSSELRQMSLDGPDRRDEDIARCAIDLATGDDGAFDRFPHLKAAFNKAAAPAPKKGDHPADLL